MTGCTSSAKIHYITVREKRIESARMRGEIWGGGNLGQHFWLIYNVVRNKYCHQCAVLGLYIVLGQCNCVI